MINTESHQALQKMIHRIVSMFEPQRIILFGSHAQGVPESDSDLDLLVVMEVQKSKRATAMEIDRALADRGIPLDLVVMTPEEYEKQRRIVGTITKPAAEDGQVVYERVA
jgi:predicted nucleotidyltransferase